MIKQFEKDVDFGLSSDQKTLPSKYFYDKKGDELFTKIMNLPEYYLTRAEDEIFEEQTENIISALGLRQYTNFELVELGAGDGTKTKKLLRALLQKKFKFDYLPVDISQNALDQLEKSLLEELPQLKVKKQQGDYFQILETLKDTHHPKVILFLGSNLGNMTDEEASNFIYQLGTNLKVNDKLFLGVDLIKSKDVVLPAYNDKSGVTRAFNLNLLHRINTELNGDFHLAAFDHTPEYTQEEGIARSSLTSMQDQIVKIGETRKSYHFKKGEKIDTEISRKYNDQIINSILKNTDFKIEKKLMDSKKYFADYIIKRT